MGSAYVAVADEVTAGYWNPAGLALLNYPEIILMHSRQFSGELNYDYGAFAVPVGTKSSIGLSLIRVGVDDIIRTAVPRPDLTLGETYVNDNGQLVRNTPFPAGTFSSADYAMYLTYAKQPSTGFAYGTNVKVLYRSLGDNSAWGIGFDIGFRFKLWRSLLAGINFQDVTSTLIAWDTSRRELITPSIRAGLAYPLKMGFAQSYLLPAVDTIFRFENRDRAATVAAGRISMDFNLGLEYRYHDLFALRVGRSEFGNFTAGAGLFLPKLQIDYAFLGHEDLGNTHRISAKLTLQEPKFRRK
jgi:hypothetical protein